MPAHHLKNFEIQKYYMNEPRFNGVYSKKNLSEICWYTLDCFILKEKLNCLFR